MSPPGDRLAPTRRRSRPGVRRDRRGRGPARPCWCRPRCRCPAAGPSSSTTWCSTRSSTSRARWASKLESVEFAVEDVPAVPDGPPEALVWGTDVIEDGAVPLARLLPAGSDPAGRPTPPRIVRLPAAAGAARDRPDRAGRPRPRRGRRAGRQPARSRPGRGRPAGGVNTVQDTPRRLPLAGRPPRKLIMNAVPRLRPDRGTVVFHGYVSGTGSWPIGGGPVSDVGVPDRLA